MLSSHDWSSSASRRRSAITSQAATACRRVEAKQQNGPRGARHQARASRHNLVFGRSVRITTMMQSCASAAKLRGGGPILFIGMKAMRLPGHRHLGSSKEPVASAASGSEWFVRCLLANTHIAGRSETPSGISPVVTMRHSVMSSLRAKATIIVLRNPPRPSAVRARYHSANALFFWNMRKRQAN